MTLDLAQFPAAGASLSYRLDGPAPTRGATAHRLLWICVPALLALCGNAFAESPHRQQSYTYACSDLGTTVTRASGGATMTDYMLVAGTACLQPGSTITIHNADPSAELYLYGTLIEYPGGIQYGYNAQRNLLTFIEGGASPAGVCPLCLSVSFVAPGQTRTFIYDGTTTTYPNGTIDDARGAPIDWAFSGQTWRLTGATHAHASDAPGRLSSLWTSIEDPGINQGPTVALWGQPWSVNNGGARWSFNVSPDKNVVREELRNGDMWWNEPSEDGCWACERTLLQANTYLSNDVTYWAAYAFKWSCSNPVVGTDTARIGSYWLVVEDLHSDVNGNGVYVPFQSEMLPGGYFAIDARWQNGNAQNYVYIAPKPLVCGVWHNIVRQWKTDPAGGFLNEWFDGKRIVRYKGPLGNAGDTPYQEFEIYRANFSHGGGGSPQYKGPANTYVDYFANVRVGTKSLAWRIHNPLPVGEAKDRD